jgi:transglutaminase-like putative cysteine protease
MAWRVTLLSAALCWSTAVACQPTSDQVAADRATTGSGPATASGRPDASANDSTPGRETWDIVEMMGAKVGHAHTSSRRLKRDDRELIETESRQVIELTRLGQTTSQTVDVRSLETPDGALLSFQCDVTMGAVPMTTMGVVRDGQLVLTTTTQGTTSEQSITWPEGAKGLFAAEQLLRVQPMKPGETRTLSVMVPVFNQLGTVRLTARDYEKTSLVDRDVILLRVDTTTELPGGLKIDATEWTDRTGEVLKTSTPLMKLETYRVPRRVALGRNSEAPELDLVLDVIVPVERAIPVPHETAQVTYRVRLERDDPAAVFSSGGSQQVQTIDAHIAEITVRSLRPAVEPMGSESAPKAEDRDPNGLVQSDDARVVALAKGAVDGVTGSWPQACALEKTVYSSIRKKNFSQAFATAAEVAESLEGDCTEHAVLLAAAARAVGLPARVATGLIYIASRQGFGYHMWCEVYVDDGWIPFDATLGRGGIGAAHIKLGHSSLSGGAPLASLLGVAQVMGQLKIEVIDVKTELASQ